MGECGQGAAGLGRGGEGGEGGAELVYLGLVVLDLGEEGVVCGGVYVGLHGAGGAVQGDALTLVVQVGDVGLVVGDAGLEVGVGVGLGQVGEGVV